MKLYSFVIDALIISGKSKKDLHLLANIAEKMGLDIRILKEEDLEDFGLAQGIDNGRTNEFIDTDEFLKSLK